MRTYCRLLHCPQVDAALQGTDPHAVGVCIKPLSPAGGSSAQQPEGSVDASAFEALLAMKMRRGSGKAVAKQQQQQQQQQQQGQKWQQDGSGGSGGFGQQQQQRKG